jgi:hypothetical protein
MLAHIVISLLIISLPAILCEDKWRGGLGSLLVAIPTTMLLLLVLPGMYESLEYIWNYWFSIHPKEG